MAAMRRKTDRVICGTCQYWTGKRVPCFDKNGVPKVDIIDYFGQCENINSRFVDEKRKNDNSCKYHSKWTELL